MKNNNTMYYKIAIACFLLGFFISFLLFRISGQDLQEKHLQTEIHTDLEHDEHANESEDGHGSDAHEAVALSSDEIKELGIVIKQAGPGTIQLHTDLVGEIKADPTRLAHIVPRFAGIVKEVRKAIGDHVKKNETIAVIESNESLTKYNVVSGINGTIIDIHMTAGELTGENNLQEIIVADLTRVWAELSVYQNDMPYIKKGQLVKISAGYGSHDTESQISWVSPVVDVKSRTTVARVLLENKTGKWKPGMFITAQVLTLKKRVKLAVEKNSLQIFEGQTVIFTRDKHGFEPQPVTVGIQNTLTAEILSGLYNGQKYASKGAFTIKAEIMKESFGEGHNH